MTSLLYAVHRYVRMLPLVCALALLAGPAAVEAACPDDPGSGTPSCGGDGAVATQGNTSDTPQGAGNPINVITGNKYQREVDLPALPGVLGLEIVRHYNSALSGAQSSPGILGRGWRLSYETDLTVHGHTIEITQADGTLAWFSRDLMQPEAPAVVYRAASPLQGRILANKTAQGTEYTWFWLNGRQLNFNAAGKLVQIVAPSGEFLTLQRDIRGWLVKVTDPQGRSLHLHYLDNRAIAADRSNERFRGVQSIDSPVGRFTYAYGSTPPDGARVATAQLAANLVKVGVPTHYDADQPVHAWTERGVSSSSISRLYHYENAHYPTLLTGISVLGQGSDGKLMNQRLVTWGYDGAGRANLSVKGVPARYAVDKEGKTIEPKRLVAGTGIEQVTLAWPEPGRTVLTNSLGRQTTYKTALIAGEHRILEVRGAGCASCGPANIRYGYDSLGRLVEETQLAVTGEPVKTVKTERDGLGRVIKVSTIAWRNGKPRAPRWQLRYAYGRTDTDVPSLIAKPSVVPGREHQIHIAYNDKGQPLTMTETGFSPLGDKDAVLAVPQAKPDGTDNVPGPLSRTISYTYQTINGRSLLIQIDGPLKNGPKNSPEDSDITRAQWDRLGNHIVGWTQSGGSYSTLAYASSSGQLAEVKNAEGFSTAFVYDARSQLVQIHRAGPGWARVLTQSFKYDALGQRTETGTGSPADKTWQAQTKADYDALGRPLWIASALGIVEQQRYDTESHLIESGRYGNSIAQVQRYSYDLYGRLTQVADNKGTALAISYDAQGTPRGVTDALGRTRELFVAPAQKRAAASAPVRQWRDDFGRIVATASPDSGATLRRFDAANRLIVSVDADGNRAEYQYDAGGRITRQRIADRQTGNATETTWRYQGKRLVALDHPAQSERYEYDQRGLLTTKAVLIKQADGSELTSITRYAYDETGRLTSTSLPDGSHLVYERNGQHQIVALKRSRLQTAWLQWLLPAQTIVDGIERDLIGLRTYTNGNGIKTQYQRSREGVLARVVYLNSRTPTGAVKGGPTLGHALDWLIGVARAADVAPTVAGVKTASASPRVLPRALPGALGLPADPRALLDTRYLWDVQGNLLYTQRKDAGAATSSYAYDGHDRLIVAATQTASGSNTSRYFYDASGNRVLSQQGIADQADIVSHTVETAYQGGSHRWINEGTLAAHYDPSGQPRRVGQREYVWDALGKLIEVREENHSLARYRYNHRGERIVKRIGQQGKQAVQYLYEDSKLVAEIDARGSIVRQYVYLGEQPIATIDTPEGKVIAQQGASLPAQIAGDIGTAFEAWFGNIEQTHWLHANHLGAIEAVTDAQGTLAWQMRYGAFGQIMQAAAAGTQANTVRFELNLRLPGQYEDSETGLYYNGQRYYDPQRGRYLTPDPLGTPDGPNPYAYVRNNPLRYIDPSGLILFAFDGTGNSNDLTDPAMKDSNYTNVWRFLESYDDGNARYVSGVGTVHKDVEHGDIVPDTYAKGTKLDWLTGSDPLYINDMGGNYSGPARIDRMALYLKEEANAMDDNEVMNIDIVGFSRGAAEARHFANLITAATKKGAYLYNDPETGAARCQKVNFRFMGLFDTVLSTNYSDLSSYQLAIPGEFKNVVQAVALNEYRSSSLTEFVLRNPKPNSMHWGGFPLESIGASSSLPGKVRTEMGFLGAHADIGGGYASGEDQLSLVALNWMIRQAQDAGVKMDIDKVPALPVGNPVLHDPSKNIVYGDPNKWKSTYPATTDPEAPPIPYMGKPEDRRVLGAVSGTTQRTMAFDNSSMTNADTHGFISYALRSMAELNWGGTLDARTMGSNTGTVDVVAYLQWLQKHGYCFVGDTEASCASKAAALP